MRVLPLLLLTPVVGVLTGPLQAGDDEDAWSKPVNGLQARLSFAVNEAINGTPIIVTYLELRNVSDSGNVMEIPLDRDKIQFTVTDSTGNKVAPTGLPFDELRSELGTIRLPYDSYLRFNIASRGAGIPKDRAALLDLGAHQHWVFKRGDEQVYSLQAKFSIETTKDRHWSGTIETSKIQVPTMKEQANKEASP